MSNKMWWDNAGPPDLSKDLDAAESEVVRLEDVINKLVSDNQRIQERLDDRNSAIEHLQSAIELSSETHQKIVLGYMRERDEAREAAQWLIVALMDHEEYEQVEFASWFIAKRTWPWLATEDEA